MMDEYARIREENAAKQKAAGAVLAQPPAPLAQPKKEDDDWCIAYVRFSAPEFGGDHDHIVSWEWWLRFRNQPGWTTKDMKKRAQEIAIAQYSPPMEHQETCDFCRKEGHGWDDDEYYRIHAFHEVAIMPANMDTSFDDEEAEKAPALLIAKCARMKTERDRKEADAAVREAEMNALEERHRREIEELKARHSE